MDRRIRSFIQATHKMLHSATVNGQRQSLQAIATDCRISSGHSSSSSSSNGRSIVIRRIPLSENLGIFKTGKMCRLQFGCNLPSSLLQKCTKKLRVKWKKYFPVCLILANNDVISN